MRMIVVASLMLALGAGTALAQTTPPSKAPAPATPKAAAPEAPKSVAPAAPMSKAPTAASAAEKLEAKKTAKENIADCMRLWDAATHMTKQQWARTCERIQSRLENLRIENLDIMGTGVRKKPGAKRQGNLNPRRVWNWA
jgi:hypothetical protein